MRILVFGASITQGMWDTQGGWVARIRKYYDRQKIRGESDDSPTVFNLGISGDTSAGVLNRIKSETEFRFWPGEKYAFVFSIGHNDSSIRGGKEFMTADQYGRNMEQVISIAKHYSDKILAVELTPCDEARTVPVAWADVTYTNERLSAFNGVLEEICRKHNVTLVPAFDAFDSEQQKRELLFDGLHPNDDGHELIAQLVLRKLKESGL